MLKDPFNKSIDKIRNILKHLASSNMLSKNIANEMWCSLYLFASKSKSRKFISVYVSTLNQRGICFFVFFLFLFNALLNKNGVNIYLLGVTTYVGCGLIID